MQKTCVQAVTGNTEEKGLLVCASIKIGWCIPKADANNVISKSIILENKGLFILKQSKNIDDSNSKGFYYFIKISLIL